MKAVDSVTSLIGRTPLLRLSKTEKKFGLKARLFAKLESTNPGGSVKDRVALAIIEDAEEKGLIKPGSTIYEPTSGNTGIGISMVGASRGYRVVITMPETMSAERRAMIAAYGAEVVLTPGKDGMKGAIAKAEELHQADPGSIVAGQFVNQANPDAHYRTTGPEIWEDMDGQTDYFVSAVGTGGTLTGAGRFLKEKNPNVRVIAVEPDKSPVLSGGKAGAHGIQGIGAGFVPETLDKTLIDEVIRVKDEAAFEAGYGLARTEAVLAGISSGAALAAAIEVASRPEAEGKNVAIVFPDSGDRYFSTKLFTGGK